MRQGPLIKKCRTGKERYEFFLFNNLLAYASTFAGKFKLHRRIDIDKVFNVTDATGTDKPPDFRLLINSSNKSFIVHCKDEAERNSWMKDLLECVSVSCSVSSLLLILISASLCGSQQPTAIRVDDSDDGIRARVAAVRGNNETPNCCPATRNTACCCVDK